MPEVLVYRPLVNTAYGEKYVEGGTFYQRTAQDVDKAWLSPDNSSFSSLGKSMNAEALSYDPNATYLTDGSNLGLVISGISKNSNGTISFSVTLPEIPDYSQCFSAGTSSLLDAALNVGFTYTQFNSAGIRSVSARLLDENGSVVLQNIGKLDGIKAVLSGVSGTLNAEFLYAGRSTEESAIWGYGKPNSFEKPVKAVLTVTDLTGRQVEVSAPVTIADSTWTTFKSTYQVTRNSQYAFTEFMGYMLQNDGTVQQLCSPGDEYYSEAIDSWANIKAISTTETLIAAVTQDGYFYFSNVYMLEEYWAYSLWTAVEKIDSAEFHTILLLDDGTAISYGRGNFGKEELYSWTGIIDVKAATNFTAGLKSNGTVILAGNYANYGIDVSSWTDIKSISVTDSSVLGIKTDGTVVATGILFAGLPNSISNITAAATQEYIFSDGMFSIPVQVYWMLRDDGELLFFNSLNGTVEKEPVTGVAEIMNSGGYITAILENGDPYYVNYYFYEGFGFGDSYYVKTQTATRIAARQGSSSGLSANQFNIDMNYYPLSAPSQMTTFSSSNSSVAEVIDTGVVTFRTQGEVVITATAGTLTTKVKLSFDGNTVKKELYTDDFTVDVTKGFLYAGIELTEFQLKTKIGFGNELIWSEDDLLFAGTGLPLIFKDGTDTRIRVVVRGDISGDGSISVIDFISLKNSMLGKASLSGAFLEATDSNEDGIGNSVTDLLTVKDIVLASQQQETGAFGTNVMIEKQLVGSPSNFAIKTA